MELTRGKYRHFKGNIYEVTGVGRHSETEEWFVIYKNPSGETWIRPYDMFVELVEHEGQTVQRFTLINERRSAPEYPQATPSALRVK
jgi:hypothetical protein